MTDFQAGTRGQTAHPRLFTIKSSLLATGFSLVLIWIGAWLFHLDDADALGASLVVIVLCLAALTMRIVFGKRDHTTIVAARKSPAAALEGADRRWLSGSGDQPAVPLNGRHWSLDVFAAIDAKRFAAVCETWFSWAGFDTRSEAHRTDEGVDIWLHAARMPGPVAIVRCKHWRDKPVGLQDMKEFLGVVANFQSAHGTYTTTSTYTPEALQFARENGIDAVDGRGLLRRIQTRTRQRQQALLAVAYSAQP